jgi:hypothetical protein
MGEYYGTNIDIAGPINLHSQLNTVAARPRPRLRKEDEKITLDG